MGAEALALVLLDPRVQAAISIGMDVAMHEIFSEVASLNEEQLEDFIAQKKAKLIQHEEWLRERIAEAKKAEAEKESGGV